MSATICCHTGRAVHGISPPVLERHQTGSPHETFRRCVNASLCDRHVKLAAVWPAQRSWQAPTSAADIRKAWHPVRHIRTPEGRELPGRTYSVRCRVVGPSGPGYQCRTTCSKTNFCNQSSAAVIGWLGFNGILSTQVAAISCLRKFKVC